MRRTQKSGFTVLLEWIGVGMKWNLNEMGVGMEWDKGIWNLSGSEFGNIL